ncbi:winged helix-turn-helix domain-containing protein [Myxococcota bacterium]|nr:winged helix-turn-helix domain-containing protein [Myxococcota bacterium]
MPRIKSQPEPAATWTFLTNHAHVLLCLAEDPEVLLKDVAQRVGITERAVQRIVSELEEAGYIEREREGRRNRYRIFPDRPLRHPVEKHRLVASLLDLSNPEPRRPRDR